MTALHEHQLADPGWRQIHRYAYVNRPYKDVWAESVMKFVQDVAQRIEESQGWVEPVFSVFEVAPDEQATAGEELRPDPYEVGPVALGQGAEVHAAGGGELARL